LAIGGFDCGDLEEQWARLHLARLFGIYFFRMFWRMCRSAVVFLLWTSASRFLVTLIAAFLTSRIVTAWGSILR
jgi:hypothetical protein